MRRLLGCYLFLALTMTACTKQPEGQPDAGRRRRDKGQAATKTVQPAPKPDTRRLVAKALDGTADDDARAAALEEIAKVGDRAAIYPLAGALSEEHGDLEQDFRATLTKLKAAEVLSSDLDNGDDRLMEQASLLLFYLRDPSTFDSLEDALLDENLRVRTQAAAALRVLKDPRAVPFLIGMLEHDTEADGRAAAAQALIELGGTAADTALEKALETEKDEYVKGLIERALPAE